MVSILLILLVFSHVFIVVSFNLNRNANCNLRVCSSSTRLHGIFSRRVTLSPPNDKERLLYGRVPFDDWMFTNWKLTDPNIYKQTYLESIADEMSIAARHFALRQTYSEWVTRLALGSAAVITAAIAVTLFKKKIRDALLVLLNAISPPRRAAGVDYDYGEAEYSQ